MRKKMKGVVHNAFFKRNEHGDTTNSLWGRTQSLSMEVFKYRENEKGNIVIVKREK